LSQGGKLKLTEAHWPTFRKELRNNSESGFGRLYKNPKSPKNTLKNAKKKQPTENPNNSKYQNTREVGIRFLDLGSQGAVPALPPR